MRLMLALVSLLTLAATSASLSGHALAAVTVRGMSSCSGWANRGSGDLAVIRQVWLLGYLSGRAAATDKDILKGTENAELFLWMDNYCRENPLKDVEDGAVELAAVLIRQKGL